MFSSRFNLCNRFARKLIALPDTKKKHSIDSKKYTKERHLLHKQIVKKLENSMSFPKKGDRPVAILIGGGTASGKTFIRKKIIEKEVQKLGIVASTVDLDEIKEFIPEYKEYKKTNPDQAASLVHKESYDIGNLLLKKLIKNRQCFIYESTMSRTKKYKRLVNQLTKNDYETHVYITDVPLTVAIKRAEKRALITGRTVPKEIIKRTHKFVPQTFLAVKDDVNSYHIYDTQRGIRLIASNDFIDHPRYFDFLKKGDIKK